MTRSKVFLFFKRGKQPDQWGWFMWSSLLCLSVEASHVTCYTAVSALAGILLSSVSGSLGSPRFPSVSSCSHEDVSVWWAERETERQKSQGHWISLIPPPSRISPLEGRTQPNTIPVEWKPFTVWLCMHWDFHCGFFDIIQWCHLIASRANPF